MYYSGNYAVMVAGAFMMIMVAILAESYNGSFYIENLCGEDYGTVLEFFARMSLVGCASKCLIHDKCNSATFGPVNRLCNLNSGLAVGNLTDCAKPVQYISLTQIPRPPHCTSTSDCPMTPSICQDGMCKCYPHYAYNPGNLSCIDHCDTYGDTFTLYSGHFINKAAYDKKIESVDLVTCKKNCLEEKNFTCRNLDFWNTSRSSCELSQSNARSVQDPVWSSSDNMDTADVIYGQRNCK